MRKQHILTFNETTYIIEDSKIQNDVFINGSETDWFVEYQYKIIFKEDLKCNTRLITGMKLLNKNDEDREVFYYHTTETEINLYNMVNIIHAIEENSFRNN